MTQEPGTFRVTMLTVAAAIGLLATACTSETPGGQETAPQPQSPNQSSSGAPDTITGSFLLDLPTGQRTPLAEALEGAFSYMGSPDGSRLVYGTCCSGTDLTKIANIDGTDVRTLESPDSLNFYGARWSPDGTKLLYQERNGGDDDGLTADVGNLFVQDLSTGRRTQLTHLELSRAWWWFLSPRFSADGRRVMFHLPRDASEATTWDVWSVPVTGGEPTLVLRNASFPMDRPTGPEGLQIAFVSPGPTDFGGDRLMTGREIPDSDIRHTLVQANVRIEYPSMSPDWSRIVYQDGGSIYVVDVSTGESSKVADGEHPEWLDDDTLIVTQ